MQHLSFTSTSTSRLLQRCIQVSVVVSAMLLSACKNDHDMQTQAAISQPIPPTPRLSSMVNFRDLAGADAASTYRNTEGRTLRRGVFYRSNIVAPDDADFETLNTLGIGAVYDLRTPAEISKAQDRLPQGAAYVHVNLLGGEDVAPPIFSSADEAIQMFEDLERSMVTDAAIRARLAQLLTAMATTDGAQVFHCTAGKDRTGWVAALLHTIAGVPESVIVEDYLLTNHYTREWMESTRLDILEQHGQAFVDSIIPVLGVRESFLRAGFEQAAESYGSMGNYIQDGLGLDAKTMTALREKLLQ